MVANGSLPFDVRYFTRSLPAGTYIHVGDTYTISVEDGGCRPPVSKTFTVQPQHTNPKIYMRARRSL